MSQLDDGCSTSIVDNKKQRSLPVSPSSFGSGGKDHLEGSGNKAKNGQHGQRLLVATQTAVPCQPRPPKLSKLGTVSLCKASFVGSIHHFRPRESKRLYRRGVYIRGSARKKKHKGKESVTIIEGKQNNVVVWMQVICSSCNGKADTDHTPREEENAKSSPSLHQ